MNDDYNQSVMVALRPVNPYWAAHGLPHLTLVYAGKIAELKQTDFNELGKAASSIAADHNVITLHVLEPTVFGEEPNKVDVLRLRLTPTLMDIRNRLRHWNASSFPFDPHVTVGPVGSFSSIPGPLPLAIVFDRVLVKWGEQELNFWLKR